MRPLHGILMVMVVLGCCCLHRPAWAQPPDQGGGGEFSPQERKWAVEWINKKLSLLMEDGLIKRITSSENDTRYEVFVSSAWNTLTVEERKAFLSDFSRARQITLHSPFLVVRNHDSGETVAEVNGRGIFLFGGEEEYFSPPGR